MTYIIVFLTVIVSIAALRNRTLFDRLSLVPYRVVHDRQWWRVITHGFVHGDYVHLAVNMFVLLSFGQFIERFFGAYQQIGLVSNGDLWYLLLYFGGMVAASVSALIRYRHNPRDASLIPIPGIIFGLLYIGYSSYMGRRQGDRINHFAHLFGALFGFLFPLLMNPSFFSVFWDNLTK